MPYDPVHAVTTLSAADKRLAVVIREVGPLTLKRGRGTVYEALVRSIIYQQLSGKAAGTIHGRLIQLLPRSAADQPVRLLALDDETLRGAGVSRNKIAALRDLSQRTLAGEVPTRRQMHRMDDEAIIEHLVQVRGVGRWTAEMILIFLLGRPDVMPAHDLGVRRGFALTYGREELPSPAELDEHGVRWQPYRSVAAWYLWRACELERIPGV